ncbi:MAG TPA: hypothetical protein VGS01_06840 [Candidatus Limnocylindria bacterium]|nr:hypothetical protein [Candidatus Limnocylindria bacterium]
MGGLIDFPGAARQNDAEWHDPADNTGRSTRNASEPSLITWLDAMRLRDGDDDGDGGGNAA